MIYAVVMVEMYNNTVLCYKVAAAPWWLLVKGAQWKHPEGLDSDIETR